MGSLPSKSAKAKKDKALTEPCKAEDASKNVTVTSTRNEVIFKQSFNTALAAMSTLNKIQDFSDESALSPLTEIIKLFYTVSRNMIDDLPKICDILIREGLLDLFVRAWDACHQNTAEFYANVDAEKFNNLNKVKIIFWNYSDKCVELARACYKDARIIGRLMKEFKIPELAISCLHQPRIRHVIKANLGILHNLLRLHNRNKEHVREDDGIDKILEYEKSTYLIVKAKVVIVLAYCINEDENWKIMTGRGVVAFIIQLLQSALESPNHVAKTYAFSAEEIVMAIIKLASNDDNKKVFVEARILPLLTQLLDPETSSTSENLEAVNCIWSLAFYAENKSKIIEEPDLINKVENLRNKQEFGWKLKKAIESLFFVLDIEQPAEETSEKTATVKKHIMLSYNWEVQHVMLQLRDYLKQENYDIWMDVDKMKDSILSAMADAVENAAVIVVAMTDAYKNSNSCRTEAEYAYKREVPILPLLLQPQYVADGWLGAMVGTKLYVDLSLDTFQAKFTEVKVQVNNALKKTPLAKNTSVVPFSTSGSSQVARRAPPPLGNPPSFELARMTSVDGKRSVLPATNIPCRQWTAQEVQEWYKSIGIRENSALAECDGVVLSQLCKLLLRAPESYYSVVRQELHLSFKDMLIFTDALESLLAA